MIVQQRVSASLAPSSSTACCACRAAAPRGPRTSKSAGRRRRPRRPPKYLVLTAEPVELLARRLRSQRHALVGSAELRILEVGAGSGAHRGAQECVPRRAADPDRRDRLVRPRARARRRTRPPAVRGGAAPGSTRRRLCCARGCRWVTTGRRPPRRAVRLALRAARRGRRRPLRPAGKTGLLLRRDARDDTCPRAVDVVGRGRGGGGRRRRRRRRWRRRRRRWRPRRGMAARLGAPAGGDAPVRTAGAASSRS